MDSTESAVSCALKGLLGICNGSSWMNCGRVQNRPWFFYQVGEDLPEKR